MPTLIPPGFAEITLQFSFVGDAEPMLTTFGADISGTPTPAELIAVAEDFRQRFSTQLSTKVNLNLVRARVGQDGGDPIVVEAPTSKAFVGGDAVPPNCAFLLQKRTALGGRKHRGRMFLPGCNFNLIDQVGNVTSGGMTSLQTAATAFLGAINGDGLTPITSMVILHDAGLGAIDPTPVTSLTIASKIATQRRRLR